MAITVGLDFGTHQTKVCIENSDIPTHKTYEFYDWGDGMFALPSVIQINTDHTLRYGNIDLEDCLISQKRKVVNLNTKLQIPPKPERPNIKRPRIFEVSPEPTAIRIIEGAKKIIPLSELYGIGKSFVPKEQFEEYVLWQNRCKRIKECHDNIIENLKILNDLCPDYVAPDIESPHYPREPHLDGYDYNYNPNLEASQLEINLYKEWEKQNKARTQINNKEKSDYEKAMFTYKTAVRNWEKVCEDLTNKDEENKIRIAYSKEKLPMIFRYFKQATFASYKWDYEISPETLTVLYLTYVIFKLEERFGTNFSIQMGIPASESSFKKLKKLAVGYLIQAYRLVEEVFQNDFDKFLSTPYEELLKLIPKFEYTDALKDQYGLIILPEAYASLRSLTANSRIPTGMNIILDMGGGTTDISFFVINNKEPEIYYYESVPMGLNFFLEYEENKNSSSKDFSVKRELEELSKELFENAYHDFQKNINGIIRKLLHFLHQDTISRGFSKTAFKVAISNRPAIYTGGGCSDIRFRKPILDFTDVKYIDKNILTIPNIIHEDRIDIPYSILATAFGLANYIESDDIIVSKKEDLFADHNLWEQNNQTDAHREHGMYED